MGVLAFITSSQTSTLFSLTLCSSLEHTPTLYTFVRDVGASSFVPSKGRLYLRELTNMLFHSIKRIFYRQELLRTADEIGS